MSEKADKKINIYLITFWFLIVSAVFLILSAMVKYTYYFNIKGNYPLAPVSINFTLEDKTQKIKNVFACFDDYCATFAPDEVRNVFSYKFNETNEEFFVKKIRTLKIASANSEVLENINYIDISVGTKSYHYDKNEISNFIKSDFDINFESDSNETVNKTKLFAFQVPFETNYKGILNHISILFLSLFCGWQFFVIPYFWFFVAAIIYILNKSDFKADWKLSYGIIFSLIMIMAILLRLNQITYYPLWMDELFVKTTMLENFKSCFYNPNEPWLFCFVEYIISKISTSSLSLRFLPFLCGVGLIPVIYLFFKDYSKKLAIFASFFVSINIINIYQSQNISAFSLSMILCVAVIYCLFKYLKKQNFKYLVFYTVLSVLMINSHYILLIFAISNFIWGVCDLIDKKYDIDFMKQIRNFSISNVLVILSFAPYLISFFKASFSLAGDAFSKSVFDGLIKQYFYSKEIFIFLCVVALIYTFICVSSEKILNALKISFYINNEKKNLLTYLIYSFAFVLISIAVINSCFKPVFDDKALLFVYFLLMLIEILSIWGIFEYKKFNKWFKIAKLIYFTAMLLICFTITNPDILKQRYAYDNFINFVSFDSEKYKDNYDIYAIISGDVKILNGYDKIKNQDFIKWEFIDLKDIPLRKIKKQNYPKTKKGVIVYTQ